MNFVKSELDLPISKSNCKLYNCTVCNKRFNKKVVYLNHLQLHGVISENSYTCNICQKSFSVPARLTRHYRTHTGEKPFQCEYCKKSFSVKENLSVHRRIHTKERPYKCDICKKAFEHSGKLHRHMRIHTGERPHKCSACHKTFIQSGQLVIHMRTHTGEKPYICESCGKGFTCSKQLKVHNRTHTGEKPYKCDICNKSFGYNHVLKLHQAAHYGEKFYKCIICQETFNSKKLMEIHIKVHPNSLIRHSPDATDSNCKNREIENNKEQNNFLFLRKRKDIKINQLNSMKASEEQGQYGYQNFSSCDGFSKKKYLENDQKVSYFIPDNADMLKNQQHCFSKQLNYVNLRTTCSLNFPINTKNSDYSQIHADINTNNSCMYIVQSNSHYKNDNTTMQYLTSQESSKDVEDLKSINSSEHFKNISPLYFKTIDVVIANEKDTCSLPPRKRCKMILDSMGTNNSNIAKISGVTSVIKFARSS